MKNQRKTSKKDSKPSIKIRDLKRSKDVKGGVDHSPIVIVKPIDKAS